MANLLLVDDHPKLIFKQVSGVFAQRGLQIEVAQTGNDAIYQVARGGTDVVLLDVGLPDMGGLEVYQRIRQIDARIPVVFVTATDSTETAIEAMRHGAFEYLFKPLDLERLEEVITEALEVARWMREPAVVMKGDGTAAEDVRGDAIVGRCPAMGEVYKAIGRVADQNVMVLITGESGTGKELVARAIYQHSGRSDKPFLAINCAAIPESLLESELFGHEKGAFTGADRRRIGKFEQCNGGTIFLDEIGDMPLATQGKILRLLQDQTFERVGGNETIQTDVRVIAATNRDLKALAEQSKFRPDLYYRLSVFTIRLPSLRERGDDLPMLVNHYLGRFNRELGRDVREVAPEAMERLRAYDWPGNIRELQSVVKQALLHATGGVLLPTFLPELSSAEGAKATPSGAEFDKGWATLRGFIRQRFAIGSTDLNAEAQLEVDRILLPAVLEFTDGNQVQAARILGISRQTLRQRLRSIGRSVVKTFGEDPV
ncbi:MAG TPA: sigma-54 dependent transcriptional regulator [Tepidisphaeraceae bacterium]|jgi:two-component system nitrogen regulation response regulator GlnG